MDIVSKYIYCYKGGDDKKDKDILKDMGCKNITLNVGNSIIDGIKYIKKDCSKIAILFLDLGTLYEKSKITIKYFISRGFSFYVFNYPGSGKSLLPGNISNIKMAAVEIYNHVKDEHPYDLLLIYGHGFGSIVSTYLASTYPTGVNGVVILMPNFSVSEKVWNYYSPLSYIMYPFVNYFEDFKLKDYVEDCEYPLTIIGCEKHEIISRWACCREIEKQALKNSNENGTIFCNSIDSAIARLGL